MFYKKLLKILKTLTFVCDWKKLFCYASVNSKKKYNGIKISFFSKSLNIFLINRKCFLLITKQNIKDIYHLIGYYFQPLYKFRLLDDKLMQYTLCAHIYVQCTCKFWIFTHEQFIIERNVYLCTTNKLFHKS